MKKYLKNVICVVLVAAVLASSCAVLFACNKDKGTHYDPETRPLTFSISALDGTFNPFFTTSSTDSTIANFTQVAMLTTTNEGDPDCGEDVPSVALDYKITSYDANGQVVAGGNVDHTTYEFVIKNGIKYSDGEPLTIDDVLFNLYVYLDPMYSGSSTIYSVDIQGLKAYRYNDASLADDANVGNSYFSTLAQQRVNNLVEWGKDNKGTVALTEQMEKDLAAVAKQLKKDLETDWNANAGTLESDYKLYTFTEDWQSFYFIEGVIQYETTQNEMGRDVIVKQDDKYVTWLDVKGGDGKWSYDENNQYALDINEACSDEEKIAEYMSKNNYSRESAIEDIKKDTAIDYVYNYYAMNTSTMKSQISNILGGMSTGSNIVEEWIKEEQANYYAKQSGSVKHISGITTKKVTSFDGVKKNSLKGEEHDVLCITINGIDPKAIYNFAFAVAPMHYYSDQATLADKDKYPYGVRPRDKAFFDDVLNSPAKNALPVGAGAYRASNEAGNASENPSQVVAKDFWSNKKVYFQRNDYFETLGSGLCNAKIKRIVYQEISENNILNALKTGQIDYGEPSASKDNKNALKDESHLDSIEYMTSGYGYIGINPKYVKDIEVRQAIMMAFNTSSVIGEYYGGTMAETINRPISKLSWAYPENSTRTYAFDSTGLKIEEKVEGAGYTKGSDGVYVNSKGERLKFKFTIAGDTTDHPATKMFEEARLLLNAHGFEITVDTDIQALKKLATGGLEVWAAAWTSTIDPDMYQVYHKDSKATSVKNWNYDEILNTNKYPEEKQIVNELSDLIDRGRQTDNKNDRIQIYAEALDKIMELAVEFPTYQRKDLAVFNKNVIDRSTLNTRSDMKYSTPTDRIWEVNYN